MTENFMSDDEINDLLGSGDEGNVSNEGNGGSPLPEINNEESVEKPIEVQSGKLNVSKLKSFVERYYLGGLHSKALFYNKHSTKVISLDPETASMICVIASKEPLFNDNAMFGIYDTKQMIELLKLFDGLVDCQLQEDMIVISNSDDLSVEINLADTQVINPNVFKELNPNKLPKEFEINFNASAEFIDKFLKSKTALNDEKLFYFTYKKNKLYLVLGNEESKSNKVNILVGEGGTKFDGKIEFYVSYLNNILKVNKGNEINIKVSLAGMMIVTVNGDDFVSTYYMGSK